MADVHRELPDPCSLEGLPVSSYREWLRRRWEDEAKKAPAFRALDVYESLTSREDVTAEEIAPVVDAARSPYFVSWGIGFRFLCRLGARYDVARQAMRGLAQASYAELRVRALASLHDRLPKEFSIELARRGLADRSRRVRTASGNVCLQLLLTELLPELEEAARAESHPETKLGLESSVGLLRDAFFLYPLPNGRRSLTVRISDGFPLGLVTLGPPWCPEDVADARAAKLYAENFAASGVGATGHFVGTQRRPSHRLQLTPPSKPGGAAEPGRSGATRGCR
jgi:hypothetical protein